MEFFFAVFFLLFYYLRPQDWLPGIEGANLVKPIVGMWLLALVAARSRSPSLPGWVRTPHDWIMLLYAGYIVFFADGALLAVLPMLAFYFLTVQSLNTWDHVHRYLKFWNGALFTVACFGVFSTFGLDFTGASDNSFTQAGRLAIGTWLHNNPNSLAHSVIAVIPASFALYFWRGSFTGRFILFPLCAGLAFYCAWLTQSKGSYLVGAALVVVAFIQGRPKWLQLILIAAAAVGGISALSFLPRMSDMNNLGADEGVQGRLLAWEMAQTAERSNPTGIGWKKFEAEFPWNNGSYYEWVKKSTHSSYVQIGADLGRYGLFLYLAGLWCSLHTLLLLKTEDTLEERCRRVLILFLLANLISGWMINRQYHTEYFLIIAASAAIHRLRKARDLIDHEEHSETEEKSLVQTGLRKIQEVVNPEPKPAYQPSIEQSHPFRKPFWNRFGAFDVACCIGLTWLTLWTWDYILKNI